MCHHECRVLNSSIINAWPTGKRQAASFSTSYHSSPVYSDVASLNIMMNGSVLFPQGHHPIWRDRSPDAVYDLTPLQRMDQPVRYFYVDFGLSVRFQPGASTLVVGDVGRDAEVPELSWDVPYDPFKADIYALGNLFDKEFEQVRCVSTPRGCITNALAQRYHSLQFLLPLIESMKHKQPEQRLTASELVQIFASTRKTLNPNGFRWRLGPKSEPAYERLFNDGVAVAKESINQLRRLVRS